MAISIIPSQIPQSMPGPGFMMGGPIGPTVLDSKNASGAYATGNDLEVRYAPQSNGLTTPVDTVVTGPTRVLESSRQLMEGWSGAAGATTPGATSLLGIQMPPPARPLLSQVENDVVQVNHPSKQPLVHLDDGDLEGSPNITSPFVTANQVNNTVEGELGRDIRYNSPDGRLNVNVDTPATEPNQSPFHRKGSGTITFPATASGDNLANDPDVIAHEQGHAILDSQRPDMNNSPESRSANEAFADGVSFFQSLQQDEVIADTIQRWDNPEGSQSGLAANLSEAGSQYFGKSTVQTEGLRDLSAGAPAGTVGTAEEHQEALRYGTALHDSTRDLYQQLRTDNPNLSSEDAFTQATDTVRSDFYRSLDFLPPGGTISQNDLGAAMMQANRVDHDGQQQSLYRGNFEEAGLRPVTADSAAQQAGLQALGERINLPQGLAGQEYHPDVDAPDSGVRAQATEFLNQNGAALGIPQGYNMDPTRVYSNDRGETFMMFKGQREGATPADATEHLGIGFNADGQLIHLDSAQQPGVQLAPMNMPMPMPMPNPQPSPNPWPGSVPNSTPNPAPDRPWSFPGFPQTMPSPGTTTFPPGNNLPSNPNNGNSGHSH